MSGAAVHTNARALTRALPAVSVRTLIIGFAAAGLLIRVWIASRNLDLVDRLFIPDDTYYTLSIARSLADGTGPAVDGVHATSGFQPLLAFLLTPVYALTDGPDTGLRASLFLGAICDLGSALLLGRIAYRFAGTAAAVIAVAVWSLSPLAVAQSLNGLETSLAVFFQLLVVELWLRADERRSVAAFALVGGAAGFAILARVDAVFVIAALGLAALVRRRFAGVAVAAAVAAVIVAPWWIYCTAEFGSPVPESGPAVGELVAVHHERYLDVGEQMGLAAGQLVGTPLVSAKALRSGLYENPGLGILAWLAFVGVVGWIVWRVRRRIGTYGLALAAAGFALLGFYTFVLPAPWFYARYLTLPAALMTVVLAGVAVAAWRARTRRLVDSALVLGTLGLLAAIGIGMTLPNLWRNPATSPDVRLEGTKGYREVARSVLASAPGDAVIGSLQSGALQYYAKPPVRVVNLDGVVDREAADALRERTLGQFARERGVTHFADWKFNLDLFLERAGMPGLTRGSFSTLYEGPLQGDEKLTLYAIEFPGG
jgi:hypothetical protein